MQSKDNKMIAKNMLFLYLRMLFVLFSSLYSSRVVLSALGVSDFGLYNVVGGVVAMFSFLNASMSSATSRFISFAIGNDDDVQRVFSTAFVIHSVIAGFVFFAGLISLGWIVGGVLNIAPERIVAAKWVYCFSLISACAVIIQVPFNAIIVSFERFSVFSYIDILTSVLKLIVVYVVSISKLDRLITYGALAMTVPLFALFMNCVYCRMSFKDCSLKICLDINLIKKMLSFTGWDMYGNLSVLVRTQGVNVLLNMFFGTTINAACGVATQVQGAVMAFANNALTAIKPQIVKSYACGDYERTSELVINAAKFTFIILLMVSLPLIFEIKFVLGVWLGKIPERSDIFCQYVLFFNLIANISFVLIGAIHATGYIRRPSIINGSLYLMVIPFSYLAFRMKFPPEVSLQINTAMALFGLVSNMLTLSKYLPGFSFPKFIIRVLAPCTVVSLITSLLLLFINQTYAQSFVRFCMVSVTSSLLIIIQTYCFVMNKEQRIWFKLFVAKYIFSVKDK